MNVNVTLEQSNLIAMEIESGHYASTSEVVREALRVWREKQIEKDLAALERAHGGAHERDTSPEEMAAILRIQKSVRAEMRHEGTKSASGIAIVTPRQFLNHLARPA